MATDATDRWDVRDRYGNKIYMTAEQWRHAVSRRPWLANYLDDVLNTIRRGRRKQDALNSHKYKYYRQCDELLPDFNHLVVVVLFGEVKDADGLTVSNNYVTTVWAVFVYGKR